MRIAHRVWLLGLSLPLLVSRLPGQVQPTVPSDREGLLKGLGMGLAAYAEENGYPGPKHVLELKDQLGLSRDQVKKTEALENLVKISASAKGEEVVQAEEELNKLFEAGTINEKILRSRLEQIGKMRADLRFIHLQAHLRMKQLLTAEQIRHYNELRGHEDKPEDKDPKPHH